MRRWLVAAALALLAVGAVYLFLIRDESVAPSVAMPRAAATIGAGSDAVVVSATGAVLPWFPVPEDPSLPELPLSEPPKGGQLAGPALQQARVLGAAPNALRPYLASSFYGESGVDVELTTGIELRFGDAAKAEQKWRAAAAVLADPAITELDYVDLHSPSRPSYGGSEHLLPAAP
jgi:cell division septal protein FtsQ